MKTESLLISVQRKNFKRIASQGFSVLELITTMVIIMILASLLFGSFRAARERTKQTQCANNQRTLANSMIMYALDNEHLPIALTSVVNSKSDLFQNIHYGSAYADESFSEYYYNNIAVTRCPKVKGTIVDEIPVYSYGMVEQLKGFNYHRIRKPSETVIIVDSNLPFVSSNDHVARRHKGGAVAAYADGHIEWFREIEIPDYAQEDTDLFEIIEGSVIIQQSSTTTIIPLTAQYAQDSYNWYDVYISMEIYTPDGNVIPHNVIDPETSGLNGGMTLEELAELAWESPEFEKDSTINIIGTAKYWTKEWKKVNGRWKKVWVQKTKRQWNTEDDIDNQVWVLRDGDPVPEVPGLNGQISVSEAVQDYVVEGENGDYISLSDNQVIYFFELGQTNPYYSDGSPNPGYDCNDLVVLMDINTITI